MTESLLRMIPQLREKYKNGENIIHYIMEQYGDKNILPEAINVSYDLQSGSYVDLFHNSPDYFEAYLSDYASEINQLKDVHSILEAGVGEATTIIPLLPRLIHKSDKVFGIDSSWSRVKTGVDFARSQGSNLVQLAVGNMFTLPFMDNSVDLVYTSHAVEPNGGMEREALQELYRVARKYLVLFEPIYEFADAAGKKRMDEMGYIKGLYQTAVDLNMKVIRYELLPYIKELKNPTGVIVIEKNAPEVVSEPSFCCPISKAALVETTDCMYNRDSGLTYPKIMGIPCLKAEQAIVATKI